MTHYPDTCYCVADQVKRILIKNCRSHRTWDQMIAHNRSFKSRANESEQANQVRKAIEKKRPEFRI